MRFGGLLAAMAILTLSTLAYAEDASTDDRVAKLEELVKEQQERLDAIAGQDNWLISYWKGGLRFGTPDKVFQLSVGGRIQNDFGFFSENRTVEATIGDQDDGTEFRRARIYVAGVLYEIIEFKAQYDFEGGDVDFKDVYIGIRKVPVVGTVRVGHQKEPFGLEQLTSSKYITFMERGLPDAFTPGRNTGVLVRNTCSDGRIWWGAGIFKDADGFGESQGDGDFNYTGRVTALPVFEDGGRKLVHVGVAYSNQSPLESVASIDSAPEHHLADDFVDTGTVFVNRAHKIGVEGAVVAGPVSFQGEYIHSKWELDTSGAFSDPSFSGYYIQGSFFVTGEHRPYKQSDAAFARVKPNENFNPESGGCGALEIAARLSQIDLNDGFVRGGELCNTTLGANWYLNPNTRISLNFTRADLEGGGAADLFGIRFQIDF